MWSGPRNISTAMMRAWENRPDTWVVDEPLYAHYLTQVEVAHPGQAEVIAAGQTDWRRVVAGLVGDIQPGKTVYFQKHMAHHLLPRIDRGWLTGVTNCFLIRSPADMLASLERKMGPPALRDTGLPQQREIFRSVRARTGAAPPVLEAAEVLRDPAGALRALCGAVGVPFSERMLSWPAGPRATDGVWAKYWYDAVERSSGFEPHQAAPIELPSRLQGLAAECLTYYEELYEARLQWDNKD
jgi:Sulfotransferase domain